MTHNPKVDGPLMKLIPLLADIASNKEAIREILMGVYIAGINDGRDEVDGLLTSVINDIAPIVAKHVLKDAVGVKDALDAFVARRCVITSDGTEVSRVVH